MSKFSEYARGRGAPGCASSRNMREVKVGGCGRTVAPSAAVVVDSSEPGKLARLLTLSTSYPSARLTCP